jgi:hypothetical protein
VTSYFPARPKVASVRLRPSRVISAARFPLWSSRRTLSGRGADGKRSHYASKYFWDFLGSNGFADTTLNFHSLRRSFAQRCEQAKAPRKMSHAAWQANLTMLPIQEEAPNKTSAYN